MNIAGTTGDRKVDNTRPPIGERHRGEHFFERV
jgi:hypothetical protein